ncbi:hypothetical protein SEA_PHLORENCE_76 [Mycobacterium phage Phlorence]|nr:hypothetical protein SEA_PHLORENCE_76 [Mycobacterium phage Phlorence]ATW61265.1 hypothetical protein SEA_AGENTM_77 [Mycobacterium phage AgentM]
MTQILDIKIIPTPAGDFTMTWYVDDFADRPFNYGFAVFMVDERGNDWIVDGPVPVDAYHQLRWSKSSDQYDYERRSGAAVVRWLTLKGHKGVTLLDQHYAPVEPSADRFDNSYFGIAVAPADLPEDMVDEYVRGCLREWQAWAAGDTFGWVLSDPEGTEVDSCWNYFGFWDGDEQDYTLRRAEAIAEADAEARKVRANMVGAGFVGIV